MVGLLALVPPAIYLSWVRIPPNWAPWGRVELDRPPGWFARLQINSLAANGEACHAALDRAQLSYARAPDTPVTGGCGFTDSVRIVRSRIIYSQTFVSRCALTAALYWYEQRLQELGFAHLGAPVARIDHLGSYACRNINHAGQGRRSEHAMANAIDIAGFRLTNGVTINVQRDWGQATPRGRFLAAARDEACRFFNAVLGPDYNAAHANHFHLDLGRARICR